MHKCICSHEHIKFCRKCQQPYCEDCGKEWAEPCTLPHYWGGTTYNTGKDCTPTVTWDSSTITSDSYGHTHTED